MAGDTDDTFDGDDTPAIPPKAEPPKFKSRYLRDAEDMGLSEADINDCENNAELVELIRYEREKQTARRNTTPERPRREEPVSEARTATGKEAPLPEAEEDWAVDDEEGYLNDKVKAELKRLGKELLKAKKGSSTDRIEKLEKMVQAQQEIIENQARRSHPLVKRGNAAVQKYKSLFGTEFDEDGKPPAGTFERFQYDKLMLHLFGSKDGEYPAHVNMDLDPEVNVERAVKKLFGEAAAAGHVAADDDDEEKPSKSRAADWRDAGQAPPTNRNGSTRTGIPDRSGKEARVARRAVLDPDPLDDDDDF